MYMYLYCVNLVYMYKYIHVHVHVHVYTCTCTVYVHVYIMTNTHLIISCSQRVRALLRIKVLFDFVPVRLIPNLYVHSQSTSTDSFPIYMYIDVVYRLTPSLQV